MLLVVKMKITKYFAYLLFLSGNAEAIQLHTFRIRTKDLLGDEHGKGNNAGVPTSTN